MELENNKKINFFKKVWYSITKFEKYPDMAAEGVYNAIKYLAILMIILSILLSVSSLIESKKMILDLAQYIQDNIPDFSYEDGKISMDIEEPIILENVQYNGIDYIIINPNLEDDNEKDNYKNENGKIGTTVYLFKNQIILENKNENNEKQTQEYTYQDFIQSYTQENITQFNKNEFIDYLRSEKMNSFYMRYTMSIVIYLILMNIIVGLLDSVELAVLGWITSITARIKMRFTAIFNMAIYSLTLSILLNCLYVIINYFTDFTIQYFSVAYITIAYVYLAASIFIIKDDYLKKQEIVEKIKQEQEKVREEIKEQERKKEEKKEEKKKEDKKKDKKEEGSNNEEPNGSEA